jgi:hypothetical protein
MQVLSPVKNLKPKLFRHPEEGPGDNAAVITHTPAKSDRITYPIYFNHWNSVYSC